MKILGSLLVALLVVACGQPKTTIGVGGGPTVAGTGGVGTSFPQGLVGNGGVSAGGITGVTSGGAVCPIFHPQTGEVVCSCASLRAGEC